MTGAFGFHLGGKVKKPLKSSYQMKSEYSEKKKKKSWPYVILIRWFLNRAGEPESEHEPVGAGCFWLLGAGAA